MTEDTTSPLAAEASNTPFGSFKLSGANLNNLFTILIFMVCVWIATILFAHNTDAKDNGKEVAKELKEANKEVANTLKESNKDIAKVLGELTRQIRIKNCTDAIPPAVTPQQRSLLVDSCRANQ